MLCEDFGVARNTIRRALASLGEDGLIETLPGVGRVVCDPGSPDDTGERNLPQYRRIANALRTQIESGPRAPGDALPSEATLVAEYGVSRGTARQALADLEGAGLIESRHGKGRYVRRRL